LDDAVILAAGGSRRMGRPKALLEVDGAPLLLAHVRAFHAVGLRVTVVLGAHADTVSAVLPAEVRVVRNERWDETGPAESAHLGLAGLGAALLTPVDVPPASTADLHALIAAEGDAVLSYRGEDGHPVRVEAPHPPARLDRRLADAVRIPSEDPDRLLNLNTPEAWSAWLAGRRGLTPGAPVA
jgi:nicotine blue oxidoreductase